LIRAENRVLSALASLQGDPDWQVVKEWMVASRDADHNALSLAKDEVAARWLQGSVQTLTSIIETSDEAMGIMHRKRTE
jgi:hypothetical protein